MTYCTECGKPTDNGLVCEDCIISNSPWLLSMKNKEDDLVRQVKQLKSENAALRERLDKAVLGKCIYYINSVWNDATMTRKEEVCQGTVDYVCDNFVEVAGLVLKWDEIYFTREAAESHLAELKGEKE